MLVVCSPQVLSSLIFFRDWRISLTIIICLPKGDHCSSRVWRCDRLQQGGCLGCRCHLLWDIRTEQPFLPSSGAGEQELPGEAAPLSALWCPSRCAVSDPAAPQEEPRQGTVVLPNYTTTFFCCSLTKKVLIQFNLRSRITPYSY